MAHPTKAQRKQTQRRCPEHDTQLVACRTRYGWRYDCPESDCDVMCWGGQTSTPADQETRDARRYCHAVFDGLWKARMPKWTRNEAYQWLQKALNKPQVEAHIGMLDLAECEMLLAALGELTGAKA